MPGATREELSKATTWIPNFRMTNRDLCGYSGSVTIDPYCIVVKIAVS